MNTQQPRSNNSSTEQPKKNNLRRQRVVYQKMDTTTDSPSDATLQTDGTTATHVPKVNVEHNKRRKVHKKVQLNSESPLQQTRKGEEALKTRVNKNSSREEPLVNVQSNNKQTTKQVSVNNEFKAQSDTNQNVVQNKVIGSSSTNSQIPFETLDIVPQLKQGLKTVFQFNTMTLIQSQVIPPVISRHSSYNVVAQAKTGSGKTLAFLIPMLNDLLLMNKNEKSGIYGLVLSPTRELALQIESVASSLIFTCNRPDIHVVSSIGGTAVKKEEKCLNQKGIILLVATPRRLLMHHMANNIVDLSKVRMITFDEADRLLDDGFEKDIQQIAAKFPANSRRMLFSATMTGNVTSFATRLLGTHVKHFGTEETGHVQSLEQRYVLVDGNMRLASLIWLIQQNKDKKVIVFLSTNQNIKFVSLLLKQLNIGHDMLNGSSAQTKRTMSYHNFSTNPNARLLIATDVAARGLDFPDVGLVIQFELPQKLDDYFHRIGRSARAEKTGRALTLISTTESATLAALKEAITKKYGRVESILQESKLNSYGDQSSIKLIQAKIVQCVQESKKSDKESLFCRANVNASIYSRLYSMTALFKKENKAIFLSERKKALGL